MGEPSGGQYPSGLEALGQEPAPALPLEDVFDPTGAGDTFNAGYLAGRLMNKSLEDSAKQGIRCAGIIIRHRGAIIDKAIFDKELGA